LEGEPSPRFFCFVLRGGLALVHIAGYDLGNFSECTSSRLQAKCNKKQMQLRTVSKERCRYKAMHDLSNTSFGSCNLCNTRRPSLIWMNTLRS